MGAPSSRGATGTAKNSDQDVPDGSSLRKQRVNFGGASDNKEASKGAKAIAAQPAASPLSARTARSR